MPGEQQNRLNLSIMKRSGCAAMVCLVRAKMRSSGAGGIRRGETNKVAGLEGVRNNDEVFQTIFR